MLNRKNIFNKYTVFSILTMLSFFVFFENTSNYIVVISEIITNIFINSFKLISLPIIFFSLISTLTSGNLLRNTNLAFKKIFLYTLSTTIIASTLALLIYLWLDPIYISAKVQPALPTLMTKINYLEHLRNIIPSNIIAPFYEGKVISVLILAFVLSAAIMALPEDERKYIHKIFEIFFKIIMKIVNGLIKFLPVVSLAFLVILIRELNQNLSLEGLGIYLLTLILANLAQGCLVLPLLLYSKGISPKKVFKEMFPALLVAFFSKSSASALPTAMQCAEKKLGIPSRFVQFSFPLCTTINMNACASFILITTLFVAQSNGLIFKPYELILWIFIATIAAIGNAGVPMGCYFLTSLILTTMDVPLYLLGLILPFYALLDMLESSINIWSDSCITVIASRDLFGKSEAMDYPIKSEKTKAEKIII